MDYTAEELLKYAADSDDGAHLDPSEAAIILRAHAAKIEECERATAALRELRTQYFVAGGEMTNTEASVLIDAARSRKEAGA